MKRNIGLEDDSELEEVEGWKGDGGKGAAGESAAGNGAGSEAEGRPMEAVKGPGPV